MLSARGGVFGLALTALEGPGRFWTLDGQMTGLLLFSCLEPSFHALIWPLEP